MLKRVRSKENLALLKAPAENPWTKTLKNYSAAWLFRNILKCHKKSAFGIIFRTE